MASRLQTAETVVLKLDPAAGMDAMRDILQARVSNGTAGVTRMKWGAYLTQIGAIPPFLERFKQYKPATVKKIEGNMTPEVIKKTIIDVLVDVLGDVTGVNFEGAFMDMGLDSLAAVEFRNRTQQAFGGLRLSPTLMFDYPTIADLTDYVAGELGGGEEEAGGAGEVPGEPAQFILL